MTDRPDPGPADTGALVPPHKEKVPTLLGSVNPVPPRGIKYCIGGESWLARRKRTPVRMVCEEWASLGPLVLDATIPKNAAGFRVRVTQIMAPKGAQWFTQVNGLYFWTAETPYQLMEMEES